MSAYKFSSEDISSGAPGYMPPLSVEFSPDGELLTYLYPDETGKRKVFAVDLGEEAVSQGSFKLFDTAASTEGMSLQEQLRRERMRLFTQGIASYEWSHCTPPSLPPCQRMIVPLNGKVLLFERQSATGNTGSKSGNSVTGYCTVAYDGSGGEAVDPHLSPDGLKLAFVINDDLYFMHIPILTAEETGADTPTPTPAPIRLTHNGAKRGVTCGLADFLAQEEMDRYRGFWWSPDSCSIVYAQADESQVPDFDISHPGKAEPTKHTETHRYPFAGQVNPLVTLAVVRLETSYGAVPISGSEHVWLDLVDSQDPSFTTVKALGVKGKEGEGKEGEERKSPVPIPYPYSLPFVSHRYGFLYRPGGVVARQHSHGAGDKQSPERPTTSQSLPDIGT